MVEEPFEVVFMPPGAAAPIAQGNALGNVNPFQQALKGRFNPKPQLRDAL
jgi:hypothetical protein